MFALNREEKKAALVILVFACIGLCVRFAAKTNHSVSRHIALEEKITQFDANQITLHELLRFRVFPRKVAESYISFRNEQGPFRDIEDVKRVPGIGPQRFEKLKNILYVD